jgi:hypothetical protein
VHERQAQIATRGRRAVGLRAVQHPHIANLMLTDSKPTHGGAGEHFSPWIGRRTF